MEVVVAHANTDFDAFASLLACRRLYPDAVGLLPGTLNRNVREFARLHAEELRLEDAARVDTDRITRIVAVEATDPSRLGELEAVARRPGVDVVWFDHHPVDAAPPNAVLSDDGALTTTLVGILAERDIAVTALEATAFALGIHEDTGSLTYPSTTLRDVEALDWCLRRGARQETLRRYLCTPLTEAERGLLDALLAAVCSSVVGGTEVLVSAVEWPAYVDGVANVAAKLVDLTECPALVCLVEMEGRVVCVVRSRTPELDASALARALGGGGHPEAASATRRGGLAQSKAVVMGALPSAVRAVVTAGQVMSRPARFVSADDTVGHAIALCQRHRQSGVQVGDPRSLVGVVSREDLDKAIGHGLSHAPVRAIMSPNAITCDENTPLAELRRLLIVSESGRVPVLRSGEVVGVVTRGDVLRALGEGGDEPGTDGARNVGETLLALPGLVAVFDAVQAVSGRFDGVYLVGGTVRDILMGESSFDVDVAVEGDGIALGRALADALGGRAVPHERFGTAVVLYDEGGRLDVATTRTELYDSPAALPTVEQASLRQDLYRRDFTVNAMAVSLKGEDFGRLVDYFGGRDDLERGVIRVLHNLSFIDDPTRIFRAIRYENRYGFRMDGHTAALARACIEMGLVGELSSARLRDELELLLGEERVSDAVVRLGELGLGVAIHPGLATDSETVTLLERVDELRDRLAAESPAWRLRLAVLVRRLTPDELYEWFERLRLRRRDADDIADAVVVASRLAERLEIVAEPAEARRLIEPHYPEGALLALALAPPGGASSWLWRYFDSLRSVALEIAGSDLAALGLRESPRVGQVLGEVLRRKVNGEIAGREEELEAARALVGSPSEPGLPVR